MYADYQFYKDEYFGNIISDVEFPRLEDKASDKLYSFTMGRIDKFLVENSNGKLELDGSKISSNIKKAVCKIAEIMYDLEQAENTYRQSLGHAESNGMITGKTVKSISAGAESVTYSDNPSDTSVMSAVAKADKQTQDRYMFDAIRDYLGMYGLLSQAF